MVHLGTTIDMNRKQRHDQSAIVELWRQITSDIHGYALLCEIDHNSDVSFNLAHQFVNLMLYLL